MKVLLITGKGEGHNLFPVKEVLEDARHEVEINLLLSTGERDLRQRNFYVVLVAKEPSTGSGMDAATFERTLSALDTMHARKPQVKIGVISKRFTTEQAAILAQRGFQALLIDELKTIVKFVATVP